MTQGLVELSLSAEIRTALSGAVGAFGNVYETLFAYEKADWSVIPKTRSRIVCGGESARGRAHVLIAAATSEAKDNTEQAPGRRRLNRASGNHSCVLADSGFPFAG
jgi:c-di-GMP-related signal transduction protein